MARVRILPAWLAQMGAAMRGAPFHGGIRTAPTSEACCLVGIAVKMQKQRTGYGVLVRVHADGDVRGAGLVRGVCVFGRRWISLDELVAGDEKQGYN